MLAHWRKLAGGVTDRSCHVNPARAKPISLVYGGRLGQNQNQIHLFFSWILIFIFFFFFLFLFIYLI